jgi:hypothetical protein
MKSSTSDKIFSSQEVSSTFKPFSDNTRIVARQLVNTFSIRCMKDNVDVTSPWEVGEPGRTLQEACPSRGRCFTPK